MLSKKLLISIICSGLVLGLAITPASGMQEEIQKLDECPCMSRELRSGAENIMINKIANTHEDKTKKLVCVSFGSGKLRQDFIIQYLLAAKGFNNVLMIIIDKEYFRALYNPENSCGYINDYSTCIDQFCKGLKKLSPKNSVPIYHSFDHYKQDCSNHAERKADVFFDIDSEYNLCPLEKNEVLKDNYLSYKLAHDPQASWGTLATILTENQGINKQKKENIYLYGYKLYKNYEEKKWSKLETEGNKPGSSASFFINYWEEEKSKNRK